MVLSHLFWVLNYVPILPPSPIKLFFSLWILLPQNEGEAVAYVILQGYFVEFERRMTGVRNAIFENLLLAALAVAKFFVDHVRAKVGDESVKKLRAYTQAMDRAMAGELQVRAKLAGPSADSQAAYLAQKRAYGQEGLSRRKRKVSEDLDESNDDSDAAVEVARNDSRSTRQTIMDGESEEYGEEYSPDMGQRGAPSPSSKGSGYQYVTSGTAPPSLGRNRNDMNKTMTFGAKASKKTPWGFEKKLELEISDEDQTNELAKSQGATRPAELRQPRTGMTLHKKTLSTADTAKTSSGGTSARQVGTLRNRPTMDTPVVRKDAGKAGTAKTASSTPSRFK